MTLLGLMLAGGTLSKVLTGLLISVHVLLCLFLIAVVLLQSGRAGDLASAFGGGQSQANIAAMSSENILTRATKISAFSFMATSLLLALFAHGDSAADSVLDVVPEKPAVVAPVEPDASVTPVAPETPAPSPATGDAEGSDGEAEAGSSSPAMEGEDDESMPADAGGDDDGDAPVEDGEDDGE